MWDKTKPNTPNELSTPDPHSRINWVKTFSSATPQSTVRTGSVAPPATTRLSTSPGIKGMFPISSRRISLGSLLLNLLDLLLTKNSLRGYPSLLRRGSKLKPPQSSIRATSEELGIKLLNLLIIRTRLMPYNSTILSKLYQIYYLFRFQGLEIGRRNVYLEMPTVGYQGFKSLYRPGTVAINHRKDPFFNLNPLRPRLKEMTIE